MKEIFVFGAGTHPKPVVEAINATGLFRVIGFVDAVDVAQPQTSGERYGLPIATLAKVKASGVRAGVVAINSNFFRARTVVLSNAFIGIDSKVGAHALLNTRASVDHDCTLGDFSSVLPAATLCGEVDLGAFSAVCGGDSQT